MATNKEETRNGSLHPQEKARNNEEQELERLAIEALLEDSRRRKRRVEKVGTMGWVKERNVNKRFLNSLILQTLPRHTAASRRGGEARERKFNDDMSVERDSVCVGDDSRGCGHDRDKDSPCYAREGFRKRQRLTEKIGSEEHDRDKPFSPHCDRAAEQQGRNRDKSSPHHYSKDAHTYSRQKQHVRESHKHSRNCSGNSDMNRSAT